MRAHSERHFSERIGWLRASVLGANDGIISTASLVMGVAAGGASQQAVLLTGVAGLVAGAMSMAAGEYVSVSSQADSEKADLGREQRELESNPIAEHKELAEIYVSRGLDAPLANQVARQLMDHDALAAHARDELGHSETHIAKPVEAALASALTFAVGAALPLCIVRVSMSDWLLFNVGACSLLFLAGLGGLAAHVGGANILVSASRVAFWGALAMALTAAIGRFFGTVV